VPTLDLQTRHFGVVRCAADQAGFHGPVTVTYLAPHFANRNRVYDGGDRFDQHREIFAQQAVGQNEAVAVGVGRAQRLDRTDHDVLGTQTFDLLLGLLTDSLTNGQQPNDARNADEDAEHG
jgi:hypothetical protein